MCIPRLVSVYTANVLKNFRKSGHDQGRPSEDQGPGGGGATVCSEPSGGVEVATIERKGWDKHNIAHASTWASALSKKGWVVATYDLT